ncbi:MAG: hypothetical protein F2813_03030 [Actinobacteria bacterium]|uniref:Unannotated protein n=1 Tax=freshwater metagenome TaxID=449393 RepID=A0A6J5ZLQ6_9ZZZZ|nr:hypothetical protein [Actinomycetota bacterium]
MKRSLISAFVAAMAMTAVLATVGIGATNKKAQSPAKGKTTSSQSQAVTGPPPTMAEELAKHKAEKTARQAKLATELGVSAGDLSDAIDAVKSDKLDADVAANKLTSAQRSAIIACESAPLTCDRSDLPAGGPGRGGQRGGPEGGPAAMASALAAKLNLPEAQVAAALKKVMPKPGEGHGPRGQRGPGGPGGPGPMGMN